ASTRYSPRAGTRNGVATTLGPGGRSTGRGSIARPFTLSASAPETGAAARFSSTVSNGRTLRAGASAGARSRRMTAGGKAAAVGTTGKTGIRGSTSVASARRLPAVSFPSLKRRSAACFPAPGAASRGRGRPARARGRRRRAPDTRRRCADDARGSSERGRAARRGARGVPWVRRHGARRGRRGGSSAEPAAPGDPFAAEKRGRGQVKPPAHLVPCQRGPRRPRVPAGWPLAAAAPPDVGLAIVEEVHQHEALRARGANAIDPPALGEEYRRVAGDAEARPGRGSAHGRRQCA